MQEYITTESCETQHLDCLLISPPHWYPMQPYLALPALQGYLRQQGFTTAIADLNILTLDHFLKRNTLKALYERTEQRLFGNNSNTTDQNHKKAFSKIAVLSDKIIRQVEPALGVLRGPGYYDYTLRHEAMKILYLATKLVSACYYPTNYTLNSFAMRFKPTNPIELMTAVTAINENPFIEYAKTYLGQILASKSPLTVGINITSGAQVIGGITAANVVKTLSPDTHVIIGGSYFSRLVDQLHRFPHIFQCVDSVIAFEGEIALAELLNCLKNKRNLDIVPHHVWKDKTNGQVKSNLTPAIPDVARLPKPDYQGMELDLYLLPEPILSVFSSRGCYWNKCSFCDHGFSYQNQYRQRSPEKVVEDMQALNLQYGSIHFDIVDEAVKPDVAEELSRCLLSKGLNFNWMCMTRIDTHLTKERLSLMRKANCRFLSFGVESNHDTVLHLMQKGTTSKLNHRVLTDVKQAGIWAHIMIIFGFPGETDEQVQTTLELVTKYHNIFHDGGASVFQLGRHSRIMGHPEKYGIELETDWQNSIDFAYEITLPYRIKGQDTASKAREKVAQFSRLLIEKKGSFERTASFLYSIKYNTTDFETHFEIFKKHDMHRQLGELDIFN